MTILANCKIEEVSLHAVEGSAVYRTRAVIRVLEITPETFDTVIAGERVLGAADRTAAAFRSTDNGKSWTETTNWSAGVTITLDLLEAANGNLFAGTATLIAGKLGEIWRSQNRGMSWTRVFQHTVDRYVYSLVQAANGDILAGIANSGEFWRSQDGGDNWAKVDQTVAPRAIKAMVRADNDDLLAGAGRFGAQGEIYRSQDNGATWTHLSTLAGEVYCYALAQDADGIVYAGSGHNCKVSFSSDNGATWTAVDLSNLDTAVYSLAVLSDGDILAGTNVVVADGAQVWRSEDQGATWQYLSELVGEFEDGVRTLLVLSEES